MLKVLHVTEHCHADAVGGTERYILELIRSLDALGFANTIVWMKDERSTEAQVAEGVRIRTLPAPGMKIDPPFPDFDTAANRLLDEEAPDLLLFHTFSLSEARLASLAKARGVPYSYIYHSPAEGCRRGTLLRWGKIPCDGEVRTWRCTACKMDDRLQIGMLGGQLAAAALVVAGLAAPSTGNTPVRRGLAVYYDSARYRKTIRRFLAECDLVVSCCEWSRPVLLLNGARENRLVHCPQGVSNSIADALVAGPKAALLSASPQFVVGYVGRVTEVKGVHLLVEAFSRLPAADARLRIVGWNHHYLESPYYQGLKKIADADARIELVPMKPFAEMTLEYNGLSLLAIPSVWRETGPLTLLEALALGVPVYGSANIGQLNLLRQHGHIVEPNTADAWLAALSEAYARWQSAGRVVERKVVPPRTMGDVAAEMAANFQAMVAKRSSVAA